MTADDVKELTDVERVLIMVVKIALKKKTFPAILQELMSNTALHAKVIEAWRGWDEISAELKSMTLGKYMDIAKVALEEIAKDDVAA